MPALTIGKIAVQAGVSSDTIRFYIKRGLVEQPWRTSSGYRLFDEVAVKRIRFIQNAKLIGFTLSEIKEFLTLPTRTDAKCSDVTAYVIKKRQAIDAQIATLRQMRRELARLSNICDEKYPAENCPILGEIERPKRRATVQKGTSR